MRDSAASTDTTSTIVVRRTTAADSALLWALNEFPNVGATADPSVPLDLTPAPSPPAEFPDLADVEASFVARGGDFVVAVVDGRILGMGGFRPTRDGHAEVLRVRVHPAARRVGVGTAVMSELERRAAAAGVARLVLDTADNQPEAIAFYEAIGYRRSGTEARPEWSWTLVFFEKDLVAP